MEKIGKLNWKIDTRKDERNSKGQKQRREERE